MKGPVEAMRIEPRWPVVVTILATLVMLAVLPGRVRAFPAWTAYVLVAAVLTPMAAVALTRGSALWLRVERTTTLSFFVFAGLVNIANLLNLIRSIVDRSAGIGGMQLLASSIGVWVTNVLIFSLLYWQMDRNGPEARANNAGARPDWQFPQTGAPEDAPLNWRPTFVDYLFIGFSTATAFSPTDALPLTSRAKMLMMLESAISLATIVIVASRAINILGN
jgi:hypothetical protein